MLIRSNDEYKKVLANLIKTGNEVNDTYELIGQSIETNLASSLAVQNMFNIDDDFKEKFINSLFENIKTEIGPYITEKYLFLLPTLKASMLQLKLDCNETRRCVISFPPEHCFQTIQFLLRENTVNVVCYMRSCDAVKNLPYDMWLCSFLADLYSDYCKDVLNKKVYKVYKITMMFGSLHIYKEDIKDVF